MTQLRQFNNRKGATVHEGDVVLVVNDKKKRADWKLGLVNKLFNGTVQLLVVQFLFVRYTTSCRWRFHRFVFSHKILEVILNIFHKNYNGAVFLHQCRAKT